MKKNLYHRSVALLAIVLMSLLPIACQNEEDDIFTAVIGKYSGSKDYMNSLDVMWSNGDKVQINNGTYSIAVDESDRNRATIHADGVTAYGEAYYAAYPADIATISMDGTLSFTLPDKEVYEKDANGRQVVHNMMAAVTEGRQFDFANLGALLHFSVSSSSADARLCAVEVTADAPVCGPMTATHSSSGWNVAVPSALAHHTRTLVFPTPEVISSDAKDFYLVVLPMNGISSFTLRYVFEDASGNVKVYDKTKSGSPFNISKGVMYRFNTVFDGTNVTVAGESVSPNTMDGTADHPYEVYSQQSWLQVMTAHANQASKHIKLGNDIEVAATVDVFKASLDGQGHTVTLTTNNISLFKTVTSASISNLTIDSRNDFTSPVLSNNSYGTLACEVSGTGSVISNCTNKMNVSHVGNVSDRRIGGLIGWANYASIDNCRNYGTIESDAAYIGGVVARSENTVSFTNNSNNATVLFSTPSSISRAVYIGGVAGDLAGNIMVEGCTNNASIQIDGSTSLELRCGGLFGRSNSNFKSCSNYGTISCNTTNSNAKLVGGLIGDHSTTNERSMLNCCNEGDIRAVDGYLMLTVGGLVCDERHLNIRNSYAFCNLTGSAVAGLVFGKSQFLNASIDNCYYYGTLTSSASAYALAGQPVDNSYKYTITNSYYKAGYTMRYGTNANDGGNATIDSSNPLTLSAGGRLMDALNMIRGSINGARQWTERNGHVVLAD